MQAGNDTNDPSARADIADEIDQLTEAIKQRPTPSTATSTSSAGPPTRRRRINQERSTPTVATPRRSPARSDPARPSRSTPTSPSCSGSGQGAADGKLLNTLRDISQDLRAGTTAGANKLRTTDMQNLDANLGTLTQMNSSVGATLNRLTLASSRIQDLQLSTTKQLSQTQDADFAQDGDRFLDRAGVVHRRSCGRVRISCRHRCLISYS